MKKLEKLKLHDVEKIPMNEQKVLYGGGSSNDGYEYYCPGEVIIWVDKDPYCPACERFHEYNENHPMGHNPITTPGGEWLFNTLPHNNGWGDHVTETSGSTYIYYGSDK